MSDERDQPEYGERATPEEQERAIAASGGIQEWQRRAAIPAHEAQPHRPSATGPGYTLNRFATLFLLGVGLVAVAQSAFSYLDLPATMQTLYTQQGIGDYAETPLTNSIGVSLVVAHALIWTATTWVSLRVLARGKTAWWIPLVGATITFAVTATLLAVLLLADPAFLSYIGAA